MADRPIIFSAPMVRALLDGRKTQTRRVLCQFDPDRDPPHAGPYIAGHRAATWTDREGTPWRYHVSVLDIAPNGYRRCDRLYVREAHALVPATAYRMSKGVTQAVDPSDRDRACVYREGWDRCAPRWRPSIHMPRWASRLTLTVSDVRVQRLQDVSEADARAEGCLAQINSHCGPMINCYGPACPTDPVRSCNLHGCWGVREDFQILWNSLHGPGAWDANPWVVALTFTVQRGNIDQMPGVAG